MSFFQDLFNLPPCPGHAKEEVNRLIEELIRIGQTDDYLSERPTAGFNSQCRHVRTRAIGKRLHEIGGLNLMQFVHRRIRRKLKKDLAAHLEYAWTGIENWIA